MSIVLREKDPVEIERSDLIEHFESLRELLEKGDIETAKEWLGYAIRKLRKDGFNLVEKP